MSVQASALFFSLEQWLSPGSDKAISLKPCLL
jgi:hypothetical protein